MRRVGGVCWLLLVGCNRIFGIAETQPWDANPDMPHVVLTWQLATTSPSGAPSGALEYPPFATGAAPRIQIATRDGQFTEVGYSSDTHTPGWILVPPEFFLKAPGASTAATWRLAYTLPGGVPHEVQWAPADKLGHLVVPMVGRIDRSVVPTGSGYKITLPNLDTNTTTLHAPSVLTTGLWTTGLTGPLSGKTVDYDFANASSLSGPPGIPDAAQGDRAFLIDYQVNPDNNGILCTAAVGSTALTQLALTAGGHTAQDADWDTLRQRVTSELPGNALFTRLGAGLGALSTMISSTESKFVFGAVPSTSFPGLIGSAPLLRLPVPVMQTLLSCPQGPQSQGPMTPSAIPMAAQPTLLGDFPTVVHVQLVQARPVGALGVTLYSGMETVIAASAGGGFRMSFPAAIPTQITLATPAAGRVDLVDNTDQIAIGAPTGAFTLGFAPEAGVGLRADYYDVYLHRITTDGKLAPVRIYTVTAPEVRIDGSVLATGTNYVFEIRSYAGHVMAPRGDFAPVDYPYGSAVVFTRTFKTS